MGISRPAADKIRRMWEAYKAQHPKGAGFADPGSPIRLAKTTEDHDQGETKAVRLMWGEKGEEEEGTVDRDLVMAFNRGGDVAEDVEVLIARVGVGWEILPRGGSVTVIGPCVTYTPDLADPDTDYETAYPNSCEGPDVLGLNLRNVIASTTSIIRMELESTGPLKLSSDTFNITCGVSTVTCYAEVYFPGLDVGDVVAYIKKDSDDSVVQEYQNALYYWVPMNGGNLQMGPTGGLCTCNTLPFNLCFSIPTR